MDEDYWTEPREVPKKKKKKDRLSQQRLSPDLEEPIILSDQDSLVTKKKKKKSITGYADSEDPPVQEDASEPIHSFAEEMHRLTKKKKKKRLSSLVPLQEETPLPKSQPASVEDEEHAEEVHSDHPEIEEHKDSEDIDYLEGWPKEDLQELFKRMNNKIPKNDSLKYNSRAKKLKWEEIKFGPYTAADCQDRWSRIEKKLRGYRILSELLVDAHDWLEKPWTNFYRSSKNNRHPDLPKKPLSSYMLYYMEKKKKFHRKYPNLEMSKLSKLIAEKYNSLSDSKKEKYNRKAAAMREEYQEKMKHFFEEHPGEVKKRTASKTAVGQGNSTARSGPKKPLTPFKMFLQDKLKQVEGIKTPTELAELSHSCKEKWQSMSSKKKIPWIRWAAEAEQKYLDELKLYCSENPDFLLPALHKSVLSKKEKAILEKMDGKPEKPPRSAYALYSRIMLNDPQMKERFVTPKERLQEIAKMWKEVPKIEKDEFVEKVKHLRDEYKMEFATYLENLPEDKKEEALASTLGKKKITVENDKKPTKKYKQMTINNVLKNLLPEKSESKNIKSLEELIRMEPAHPPTEAYSLFEADCLRRGLSSGKALRAWGGLSSGQRKKWEADLDRLKEKYIADFRAFLTNLKPEELDLYSNYRGKKGQTDDAAREDAGSQDEEEDEVDSEPDSPPSSSSEDEDSEDS